MSISVIPAYNRDYKSVAAVQADFDADKDFQIADMSHPNDGAYVNKQDLKAGESLRIRYSKLTKVTVITKK